MGRRAWTWGRRLGVALVLAAAVIGAGITVCSAWRWRVVAAALGVGLPLWAATAACYPSQFLNGALPGGVLGDVHRGLRHGTDAAAPGTWPAVVLTSLIVCAGLLGVFRLAARSVGVDEGPVRLLPLALIVLLAAGLPLSIAGWGPREGVAAWVFAAAGPAAGPGAAVATASGVLVLVAALPGAVLLLAGWLRPRRAGPEREPVGSAQSQAHELVHSAARKEDGVRHG